GADIGWFGDRLGHRPKLVRGQLQGRDAAERFRAVSADFRAFPDPGDLSPPAEFGCKLAGWLVSRKAVRPNVENVAFGICQGGPCRSVLVEIGDLGGTEGDRSLDLGREVGGDQVEVYSVLSLAR